MAELNKRQAVVLEYINKNGSLSRGQIEEYVSSVADKASQNTIIRDLDFLIRGGYIKKVGRARGIRYLPSETNELLNKYDVDCYFKVDADKRDVKYSQFNFDVFDNLKNLFSPFEVEQLERINSVFRQKINNLSDVILKKEYERLLIELSWKSSQIEGNTYSLLDTEVLIRDNVVAKGHSREEAVMILNHKNALSYIFENKDYFKDLTLKKIEELHLLLTSGLGLEKGLRKHPVGVVGTAYTPLSNRLQIEHAMERLIECINLTSNAIEKALITVLMISYIQPFEDGNKRTGRILANAVLYANGYCPLSYRSVSEVEYKKAVVIFYENNSLDYFKTLFTEQFKFAVDKYF